MADLPGLRAEIARRILDEPSDSSFFYGHHQRINNLIDSAEAVNVDVPGTYLTIFKGPPAKAACFIAAGVVADPFPRVPSAGYVTSASDYDGTNDFATRGADLTGLVDGKEGTISVWFRLDSAVAVVKNLFINGAGGAADGGPLIFQDSVGDMRIFCNNSAGAQIFRRITATQAWSGWNHLLCSWNLAGVSSEIFINDVADDGGFKVTVDDTIDYTRGNSVIGALLTATGKWNRCISELWFDSTFIDVPIEANRRLFIDANLKPVDLGVDGSGPTGSQPILYVPDGDPSDNKGSGGNFSITGALTLCSSSPSDP